MASRCFNVNHKTLEKSVVHLYADVAVGASGAPTLSRGKGIASVAGGDAASATGLYTITLSDKYARLHFADCKILRTGGNWDLRCNLVSEDVDGVKTVVIACVAGSTLTDPSSGDRLFIKLELGDTAD